MPGVNDATFLTLREAADLLRLSESGLRKWISNGTLPNDCFFQVKDKGRLRFFRDRLERWANSRT